MTASNEPFLQTLDGSTISVGGSEWALEVYAIVLEKNRRWIQMYAVGPTRQLLRVNAGSEVSPETVLESVTRFLNERADLTCDDDGGSTLVIDAN